MITSPANERLKQARRVRDGRESDQMFIEGERLIESCLESAVELLACFHSSETTPRGSAIITEIERRGCPVFETAAPVFATVSDTVNPQGVILIAGRPRYQLASAMTVHPAVSGAPSGVPLVVGIDAVQDPGNLGAIIRTAEAAGATGVVVLRGSVDPFAPKTLRGAMGSAFRIPIISDLEPKGLLDAARQYSLRLVATTAAGPVSYTDYDWRQPTLVLFGNEGNGIGLELMEQCDQQIRIPLCPPVESLNVAAAAAVLLFEGVRQRRDLIRPAGQ
jgi:RNA methyltransferase, TrmH family